MRRLEARVWIPLYIVGVLAGFVIGRETHKSKTVYISLPPGVCHVGEVYECVGAVTMTKKAKEEK